MNVFIADASKATRQFAIAALQIEGHLVVEAGDGEELLRHIGESLAGRLVVPDVLLIDVLIRGFSDLFVLKAIGQIRPRPPVVLTAVLSDRSVHIVARRLGASEVLYKPFDAIALRQTIATVHGPASKVRPVGGAFVPTTGTRAAGEPATTKGS